MICSNYAPPRSSNTHWLKRSNSEQGTEDIGSREYPPVLWTETQLQQKRPPGCSYREQRTWSHLIGRRVAESLPSGHDEGWLV